MSRLDDELRKAFRREQPSADFTQRLLERVAMQPVPKARWWQRLATLWEPPKLRWVAIGVTASLLLAIGAVQYQRLNRVVVQDNTEQAQTLPPSDASSSNENSSVKPPSPDRQEAIAPSKPVHIERYRSAVRHRTLTASTQKAQELKAEGEAAKEKVMAALAIASSVLTDAQKAVNNEPLTP